MIFFMLYSVIPSIPFPFPYTIQAQAVSRMLLNGYAMQGAPFGKRLLALQLCDNVHRDWMNVFVSSNA
jgi:hypothetical protein